MDKKEALNRLKAHTQYFIPADDLKSFNVAIEALEKEISSPLTDKEMHCKIGETVWVSPNNGKSFHTGILLGLKADANNLNHMSYIVEVSDKERKYVDFPLDEKFIDYFCKVYTRAEIEAMKNT